MNQIFKFTWGLLKDVHVILVRQDEMLNDSNVLAQDNYTEVPLSGEICLLFLVCRSCPEQ